LNDFVYKGINAFIYTGLNDFVYRGRNAFIYTGLNDFVYKMTEMLSCMQA
jgi:predicted transcriptional regulator with HTH domain